jgi:hypothetical protein
MGWWEFDAPNLGLRYPGPDLERSVLWHAGLLGEDERLALEADWRREFERSQQPGFFVCSGPGKFYDGAVGRRKHFRWCDLPSELIQRWSAGRRHATQTFRQLLDQGQEKPAPVTGIPDAGS